MPVRNGWLLQTISLLPVHGFASLCFVLILGMKVRPCPAHYGDVLKPSIVLDVACHEASRPVHRIASTAHRFFPMPLFSLWQMQLIGMSHGRTSQHLGKDGNVCVHLQSKEDPDSRR